MIVVTGATGQLGRHVIKGLLERLPADQIVAAVRSPERASDLGVPARRADYNEPGTLAAALKGADSVLLISSSDPGNRVEQHRAVIEAARQAGVSHLVYTSASKADSSTLFVVPEHKATEEIIRESGMAFTILRNGWYNENYLQTIEQAIRTGSFSGSAGDGRVASAARADYAAAAVSVLTSGGHDNRVYELTGDTAWDYRDLAAAITEVTGREVTYTNLSTDEYRAALIDAGVPEESAVVVSTIDDDIKKGLLAEVTDDLHSLIGRPTTPIRATIAKTIADLAAYERTSH